MKTKKKGKKENKTHETREEDKCMEEKYETIKE